MTDEKIIIPATAVEPANAGVPTSVANPKRASIRTIVQAGVSGLAAVNGAALAVGIYLTANDAAAESLLGENYGPIVAGANLVVVATGLVSGIGAAIMNQPAVASFIEQYAPALAPIKKG